AVQPDDFGSFADPVVTLSQVPNNVGADATHIPFDTRLLSDFPWLRPGMIHDQGDSFNPINGAIDIFSSRFVRNAQGIGDPVDGSLSYSSEFPGGLDTNGSLRLTGIPYNPARAQRENGTRDVPLERIITQQERFYPQQSSAGAGGTSSFNKPQYTWDCMFRRHSGRVQVAIFVYRIVPPPGLEQWVYFSPWRRTTGPYDANEPFLPERLNLVAPPARADLPMESQWSAVKPFSTEPISPFYVRGIDNGTDWDPDNEFHSWAAAGQWLVTQNNEVLNVVSNSPGEGSDPYQVELRRGPVPLPGISSNYYVPASAGPSPQNGFLYDGTVTHLWYIPRKVEFEIDGVDQPFTVTLEPVFATVREL
ncbi:MAG: hypothetical protein KC983_07495, partial [Phycisphaerales bacterium]|nr:hypothetical protein [Phycisphaerales bacterium]